MPIMGNERMVWASVKIEEFPPGNKAVKVSVWGMKPVTIPLQSLDAASLRKIRDADVGETVRIRVWEWVADKYGLA